jgi:hypothetical protein
MSLSSTTSDISICSNALLLLAHPSINSFDEIGAGASLCKSLYPNTYRTFLSTSNWNFATKIAQLSMLLETPTNKDYQYQYQMPSDVIRVNSTNPVSDYVIMGDKLLSNSKNLFLEYQAYVDEINLPASAVDAIQNLMASKLAYPLTNDGKKTELYSNLYNMSLQNAKFVDSQNDPNSGFEDNSLVDVRG